MTKTHVQGIPKNTPLSELEEKLAAFFLRVLQDFNWLKTGDIVLIKAAVNSPDPYPATTHPSAVKVLAKLIKDRGGVPIVGDQSGVEYVVHSPKGIVRGSSHDCFKKTKLSQIDADFAAFEEDAWESFTHFTDPKAANWPNGFYITPWIAKTDHIISLPRISTHGQGGVTLGAKNWVGILRQDSRMLFHAQGPFDFYIKYKASSAGLHAKKIPGLDFFEMIAEIQLAVASKLRGTIFVATELQTTMGPNKYLLEDFGIKLFKSFQHVPNTGVLIGSTDPVAADAAALAFLFEAYKQTPVHHKFWQQVLLLANRQIKKLGSYPVWSNPFIAHGLNLGLGEKIDVSSSLIIEDAQELKPKLINLIK